MIHYYQCQKCDYEYRQGAFTMTPPKVACPKCHSDEVLVNKYRVNFTEEERKQKADQEVKERFNKVFGLPEIEMEPVMRTSSGTINRLHKKR